MQVAGSSPAGGYWLLAVAALGSGSNRLMSWVISHQMHPFLLSIQRLLFIPLMSPEEHTAAVVLTTYVVLSAQGSPCLLRKSKWFYFEAVMNCLGLSMYPAGC